MKKAVFLHIPKTAGSALIEVMGLNYPRYALKHLYTLEDQAQLSQLLQKPELQVLYGHLFFEEQHLDPRQQYLFTFLRQPVERVISNFLYLKHSPEERHAPYWQMTLPDFLKEKQANDNQTRFLAGEKDPQKFMQNRAWYFEQARQHLRKMAMVGVQDRFRDGLKVLAEDLRWRRLRYPVKGKGRKQSEAEQLKQEYQVEIAAVNRYDQALYEEAQRLFEERWRHFSFWQRRKADWRSWR